MNPIKHALRQLKLRPSLSIVVIMMLALGIGATTAMFSLYQSDSRPPAARARTRAAREHRAGAKPLVLAAATAVLAAVVLAGAWLPAGRASRIAPTEALQ